MPVRRSRYTPFFDFSGGHNDTTSPHLLALNEGLHSNTNLDRTGSVAKRKGAIKLNETEAAADAECGLIHEFLQQGGTKHLLAVFGDTLYEYASGSLTSLYAGLTADLVALAASFRKVCYLNNGTDDPLVYWPGSGAPEVFRPGTPQPTVAPAFSANITGDTGNPAGGTIRVRVRYVSEQDDTYFGEPYPEDGVAVTVTTKSGGATGGVRITIPVYPGAAAPDFKVAKRVIERTTVGGGVYYLDGYVNDNSTTTYDITSLDSTLLASDEMPAVGRRLLPPKLFPFLVHGNRVVGFDPDEFGRLKWSEIDEFGILPEAFPAENYLDIGVSDLQDSPAALAVLGDFLVAYCGRSAHIAVIDEGGRGSRERLAGWEMGVPGPRAVWAFPNFHLVGTFKGVYAFEGGEPIAIGGKIRRAWSSIPKQLLADMFTVHRFDRSQVAFTVPHPDDATRLGYRFMYHYRQQSVDSGTFPKQPAWTIHKGSNAKAGLVVRGNNGEDIEYSGDYEGFLFQEDTGDTDAHDAEGNIAASFQTRLLDMGRPHSRKIFAEIWVWLASEASAGITLSWEVDAGAGPTGSVVLEADPGEGGEWDVGDWDAADWAGAATLPVLHANLGVDGDVCQGRAVRFTFENDAPGEPFEILGFVVRWDPVGDRSDAAG